MDAQDFRTGRNVRHVDWMPMTYVDYPPRFSRSSSEMKVIVPPSSHMRKNDILQIQGLNIRIPGRGGWIHAVQDVSLSIAAGECLGIVGESGCGKSTLCASLLQLLPPGAKADGRIVYDECDLNRLSGRKLSAIRGNEIAMIFQDPVNSLNPIRTIGSQIADKLIVHKGMSRKSARAEAARLLDLVRVPAARARLDNYPHQLSGGLCQRVMIAMALSCRPHLLIADEPTTALDVTIQAQILALIDELRRDFDMAVILVSHDLGVISRSSDRVAVMYAGRIVEEGPTDRVIGKPMHPYTRGLISASPGLDAKGGRLATIPGTVSIAGRWHGCPFAPRCNLASNVCGETMPATTAVGTGHEVGCHHLSDLQP
jgi:oligopeptide/dipeptide ABC transporter ATP-binding protein